jgi:ribosomal-protein-alanine N-acetyltransferase
MGIQLKSQRLVLREIEPSDFDFLYRMELLPETNYFEKDEPEPKEKYLEHYQWYIDKSKEVPASGALYFIILLADTMEAVGRIFVHCNWELVREWELGYGLLPAHWGKGYASEAASTIVKYAFETLGIHKLSAFCNAENARSAALLKGLGMKLEGRIREDRWIRNRWYDSLFYSFIRSDLYPECRS